MPDPLNTQQQVLQSVGRDGWRVTGTRPETTRVAGRDAYNNPVTTDQPTGNQVWSIASSDGRQVDTIIVKPPTTPNVAYENPDDPGASIPSDGYTVVQGPTHEVPAAPTQTRPPEPPTSTAAASIPVWNAQTNTWEWKPNPNYVSGAGTQTRPPEPAVSTTAPQIPSWNAATSTWDWRPNPNYKAPDAKVPAVHVLNNTLVDDTGRVIYTASEGSKFQSTQDGTILLVDPADPTNPQVVWKPTKATVPDLLPGQKPDQPQFVQRDPVTGALSAVANPIYSPAAIQRFQELNDGITQIQGMLTRGEIDYATATGYKDALTQNFDASLRGTTPYQEFQDQQARAQQRMTTGAGLLNQRVSSGTGMADSLLSSAVGIVGNKNFMDPAAVAGFSPFSGAYNFVTALGGGQGVYDAAAGAAQRGLTGDTPYSPMAGGSGLAAALLQHALTRPGEAQTQQQTTQQQTQVAPPPAPDVPQFDAPPAAGDPGSGDPPPDQPSPDQPQPDDNTSPAIALLRRALGGSTY